MARAEIIDLGIDPTRRTLPAIGNNCALHKYHWPEPTYYEEHHIVPRAWFPYLPDAKDLPKRVVVLGRTCHGDVHFHLVALMKLYKLHLRIDDAWEEYPFHTVESKMARQGMYLFVDYGGNLSDLIRNNQFGQI